MSALKKLKNLLIATLNPLKSMATLTIKQSNLDRKFSDCISELRLAPKLVSTMMELVSSRANKVKDRRKYNTSSLS